MASRLVKIKEFIASSSLAYQAKHMTTEVKPLGISIPRVRKRDESDEDRGSISPPDQQVTKICPPLGDDVQWARKVCFKRVSSSIG